MLAPLYRKHKIIQDIRGISYKTFHKQTLYVIGH